ncbi:unnamed protein product, partial [Scytosiphon promiscuus]
RQDGCPWDARTCAAAASGGHLAALKWARQNGCLWSRADCVQSARENGHNFVAAWIEEN